MQVTKAEALCWEYLKPQKAQTKPKKKSLGVGFEDILKRELLSIKEKNDKERR